MTHDQLTQADLDAVMTEYPRLTDEGYGLSNLEPETSERLERERADLRRNLGEVQAAAEWISRQERQSRLSKRSSSSYGLKHVMERETGTYVTNGAFIAAALIIGVPARLDHLNPMIGIIPLNEDG